MKDNSNKSAAKAAKKSAAKDLELSVISTLKAAAAKLGHESKSLTKKIEKEAKKLAKKLSKELTNLKTAAADEAHTLLKKVETPKKEKSAKTTTKVSAPVPVIKPVKAAKTPASSAPAAKPVQAEKAPVAAKKATTAKVPKEVK